MSKQVVDTPKIEAKELFDSSEEGEGFLFENFFNSACPPDGISEEDYLIELKREFYKLKIEEAKRILGLNKK